jgi:hypothetical protein
VSQAFGALETPVNPGLVAAAFRHRRKASIPLQLISRGVAVAWFAKGDQKTWGQDGASAREGVKYRAVGMALGAVGNGRVGILDRVQRHAELGHKGLDQEGIGGMMPSSVVSGVALFMASRRRVMTAASRT